MKNQKNISSTVKDFFSDNNKIAALSLAFILLSIFLFIVMLANPDVLYKQRVVISSLSFVIGFYMIPLANMKQKDKFFAEMGKFILFLIFGLAAVLYFFDNVQESESALISDIIASLFFITAFYYFVSRFFLIVHAFFKVINTLTNKIFPNSTNHSGLKFIFEQLTTLLISVSGSLATILAIATSIKAIIDMFN